MSRGDPATASGATRTHPNLTVVDHPLVRHKMTLLRDVATGRKVFRELMDEIATLVAYEAMSDLALEDRPVETPLEATTGGHVDVDRLVLVPILRAGLAMLEGVRRLIPDARVGHVGLERERETLEPAGYYFKIPPDPAARRFLVLDPTLATGGSAGATVEFLKDAGTGSIRVLCVVAAPEGVEKMARDHPDVKVYTAALDRELNDSGYILPGLGDAGDRLFGT